MRIDGYSIGDQIPEHIRYFLGRRIAEFAGATILIITGALALALISWSAQDPSLNHATSGGARNFLGPFGAVVADLLIQIIGLSSIALLVPLVSWGWSLIAFHRLERFGLRLMLWLLGVLCAATFASLLPVTDRWPLPTGLGGVAGDAVLSIPRRLFDGTGRGMFLVLIVSAIIALLSLTASTGFILHSSEGLKDEKAVERSDSHDNDGEPGWSLVMIGALVHACLSLKSVLSRTFKPGGSEADRRRNEFTNVARSEREPVLGKPAPIQEQSGQEANSEAFPSPRKKISVSAPRERAMADDDASGLIPVRKVMQPAQALKPGKRSAREQQPSLLDENSWELPPLMLLAEPRKLAVGKISSESLEQNARLLEGTLDDFGVKGEILHVRPGPVVTLYELEPAPGIKSSRVIGLADDVARSMSAISARIAVVQGRNAIGIELPNQKRETVFLRELLASIDFEKSKHKLAIALGKTIDGEPVIVDLARMPHLLVAGTTGSGKSVAINTMILSLLYRLKPEECRLIMVDPKMLELSVYDGIPHLLTPVVTDPKKAVVALKWAVREMEDRYRKMSKVGVRNIDGFNARVAEAVAKGETICRTVHTGYNRETGEAVYEQENMDLSVLPYIVVIVDEMADLMMVAGKDIEGAIQRLAQMARAAGIHLIMATQRPSVDVITGTIKANFPTRISFQVTSKIDSRTILGEQGAEQLLGQGDMLYMAGGGRISRVHGPYVSDSEVEKIVAHLKTQGQPEYLDAITVEDEEAEGDGPAPAPGGMDFEESGDLYDRAVAIVLRDRKCSTSYIQRRLSVGYNKAASLVERMEKEGVVAPANHAGKREILVGGGVDRGAFELAPDE